MRTFLFCLLIALSLGANAQDKWEGFGGQGLCNDTLDDVGLWPRVTLRYFSQFTAFHEALTQGTSEAVTDSCKRTLKANGVLSNTGNECNLTQEIDPEDEIPFGPITLQLPKSFEGQIKKSGAVTYLYFESANGPRIQYANNYSGLSGTITNLCYRDASVDGRIQVLIEYVPDSDPSGRHWYVFSAAQ